MSRQALAPRTHCPRGHEMTPGNTYDYKQWNKDRTKEYRNPQCKICRAANTKAYRRALGETSLANFSTDPGNVLAAPLATDGERCRCGLRLPCNDCIDIRKLAERRMSAQPVDRHGRSLGDGNRRAHHG